MLSRSTKTEKHETDVIESFDVALFLSFIMGIVLFIFGLLLTLSLKYLSKFTDIVKGIVFLAMSVFLIYVIWLIFNTVERKRMEVVNWMKKEEK